MIRRKLAVLLIVLAACGGKNVTQQTKTAEPPPLPSDVQAVANTATEAPMASSSVASEAGGTIVATGEFVSPVRSELSGSLHPLLLGIRPPPPREPATLPRPARGRATGRRR